MHNFKLAKFGYVNADVTEQDRQVLVDYFKAFYRSSNSPEYLYNAAANAEVMGRAKRVFGDSFKAFLVANYQNGIGRRSEFVRIFLSYLAGEIPGRVVVSRIRADENTCSMLMSSPMGDKFKQTEAFALDDKVISRLNKINEDHFYQLVEAVGVRMLAVFVLSLYGETYNGQ